MEGSYWNRATRARVSRRRGLAALGSLAASAAFLAACGGDDDEPSSSPTSTGGTSTGSTPTGSTSTGGGAPTGATGAAAKVGIPEDTTAQAQHGGIYQTSRNADEPQIDPLTGRRAGEMFIRAYSRLIDQQYSVGIPTSPSFEGILADSWEIAPDNLSMTVKLRQGAKWDPRSPTNDRPVDAEDVVFSWNKWVPISPYGSELAYERNPGVGIESVEAVDDQTVRFNLKFPWAPLIATMASSVFVIQPREADGGFDPRVEMRGYGPWMMTRFDPSVAWEWERNPNWHKETPYMDGIHEPILPEPATILAQFSSGEVWDTRTVATPNDLVDLANRHEGVRLYERRRSPNVWAVTMGSQPGSVFADKRIRQAISYALDREALAIADSGADVMEDAGIPIELKLASFVGPFWGDEIWIDPLGDGLGEGAKYFHYNPEEAKKLLEAAGYPNGFDTVFSTNNIVYPWVQQLAEVGIRTEVNVVTPTARYLDQYAFAWEGFVGNFEGVANRNTVGYNSSVISYLQGAWHTGGSATLTRNWDEAEQGRINALIEEGVQEFDEERVKEIAREVQRLQAEYMGGVPWYYDGFSGATPFTAVWPWVKNWNVYHRYVYEAIAPDAHELEHIWFDESARA